ncbi:MFS transporter [Priestia megaterium]|uniref:MFS transporter n=1 Tax=Priestia megaterium TaxID=1404 RepID=UPI0025A4880C|nr:MFS transporter [Priestia megaterium]MDM8150093.1 MFS transporter [Priestia megaterium]
MFVKKSSSLDPLQETTTVYTKPTNVRWQVFIMLLILCAINYVDRAVLSIAMPLIQKDLELDPAIVGLILSSFFWGYALMQIPSGWIADRYRPDKLVCGASLLWGIVQTLTGLVTGSKTLIFLRVILGIAEAPLYPSGSKLQSIWLTSKERGRGATLLDSGSSLGTAIGGPIIIAFIAWFGGWRGALIGAGLLTIVVSWIVWKVIKGSPETNTRMNEIEREHIKNALEEEYNLNVNSSNLTIKIKDYFKNRNFWAMCIGYYSLNTVFYGLMTWGPNYLEKTQNLDIKVVGSSILIIFGFGVVGELIGGWIADFWRSKGGKDNVVMRTLLFIGGFMTAICILLLGLGVTVSLTGAIVLLSAALFFLRWAGLYWSIPATISQRNHVGTIAGCMNTAGNIAGIVTPIYIGFTLSLTGSYFIALLLFVIFGLVLAIASLFINFDRKIGF